mgnify:CR=1 FL=1
MGRAAVSLVVAASLYKRLEPPSSRAHLSNTRTATESWNILAEVPEVSVQTELVSRQYGLYRGNSTCAVVKVLIEEGRIWMRIELCRGTRNPENLVTQQPVIKALSTNR